MNILIVDDEPVLRKMMERRVGEILPDAHLFAFSDPEKAVEFAQTTSMDIAFLDIDMPFMNGIEAAKCLQAYNPRINIIFSTGYAEYMPDAWKLYSSGYLLKPVMRDDLAEAVKHLRYPLEEEAKVSFHCFGNFEVFYRGTPISFRYQRTKELLAYLVDREGADVTTQEIMAGVFEEGITRSYLSLLRKDLISTFEELGISDVLRISRSHLAIDCTRVDCDLYDYLDGKITRQPTEYMTQYSFGEYRLAQLTL